MGRCYGFPDGTKEYAKSVFINLMDNDTIQSTSIKTWHKAIVAGKTKNSGHVKPLAEYYMDNSISIAGVVGENFYAEHFANFCKKELSQIRTMLVHKLTSVNSLPVTTGELELADNTDIILVTEWTMKFEEDAKSFPKKTHEEVIQQTEMKIAKGDIFKWVDKGESVSIAAIVRRTRNLGIIGLVYTPNEHRGKGYATSCVLKLSEHILQSGYRHCGLHTDKSNPTSNSIYKKIGYVVTSEFTDIEFANNL